MFKNNGYEILTLDFRNPELSNHFNLLDPIIKEYEEYIYYEKEMMATKDNDEKLKFNNLSMHHYAETNKLISSLATIVMQEKGQVKDPFWNNSAKNLLEGLIGFYLEEYKKGSIKREQITMTSIKKFQNSSMKEKNFVKFQNYIEKKEYGNRSKDSLIPILTASQGTYKSITAVFGEKMALFDDTNVANITSDSDFDLESIEKKKTALFVIVPDEDKTYYKLITIIVGLLYRELVKLANTQTNKRLEVEIDWILDEFANCPPLADIESIVSASRSRGMRFHFYIQSFSQLDNIYGKDVAQIILDNCGLIYLKTNTQDTAEAISKRLGKRTIESNSINQSMSFLNYNGNKTTSLMARDVLTPEEIKQLHYKTIIFSIIGFPVFRDTILYEKFSCYQNGVVERKESNLKDLSATYFVVEKMKEKRKKETQEDNNFYNEVLENDRENLKSVICIVKKVMQNEIKSYKFIEKNNRLYVKFLMKKLNQKDKSLLKGRINNDFFYLNFINEKELEIHFTNPLNQIAVFEENDNTKK